VATPQDVGPRFEAGNHAEIQHMYGGVAGEVTPLTRDQAERWVTRHLEHPYAWVIDINGVMSGALHLHSTDVKDRRATLAVGLLHVKDLGQGYGTRAMRLLIAEAFGALNLHRLSLRVLSYNARAIAAYQKLGFQIEGRERQSARVGDTWHDDVMMGLLAPEWRAAA
jgi:RimJ/RimL family protein N-acetyltransferase